jgi:hypothetical protein
MFEISCSSLCPEPNLSLHTTNWLSLNLSFRSQGDLGARGRVKGCDSLISDSAQEGFKTHCTGCLACPSIWTAGGNIWPLSGSSLSMFPETRCRRLICLLTSCFSPRCGPNRKVRNDLDPHLIILGVLDPCSCRTRYPSPLPGMRRGC